MRNAAVVLLLTAMAPGAFAQDSFTPLIYAEEVAQTARMVQQIQNELKEVSYIYQSLQNQIQSLKSLKISSYNDFMEFLNGKASAVLSTESRIKSLQVTVNGESFALGDLMGYWDAYTKQLDAITSGQGTSSDEQAAYRLLGMSSDLVSVGEQLKDLTTSAARKAAAVAVQAEKQSDAESKRIQDLLSQSQGNQSVVANLQTSQLLEAQIAQDLLDLKLQTGSMATNIAAFTSDVQRNGLAVVRSQADEEIVGQEIGDPLSADFFGSR
jgi:conjugal transfer/entry exclusion protein